MHEPEKDARQSLPAKKGQFRCAVLKQRLFAKEAALQPAAQRQSYSCAFSGGFTQRSPACKNSSTYALLRAPEQQTIWECYSIAGDHDSKHAEGWMKATGYSDLGTSRSVHNGTPPFERGVEHAVRLGFLCQPLSMTRCALRATCNLSSALPTLSTSPQIAT